MTRHCVATLAPAATPMTPVTPGVSLEPAPVPEPAPEPTLVPAPATAAAVDPAPSPLAVLPIAPLVAAAAPLSVAPMTRPATVEPPVTGPVVYAASLRTAVAALPVRREVRSGWSTKAFASDGHARAVRIVPLAEAWASGGRTWTSARRLAFAHDAATVGTLKISSMRGRADRDPADWLPTRNRCGYVAAWTAAKLRWRLAVDRDEAKVLRGLTATCPSTRLTVVRT